VPRLVVALSETIDYLRQVPLEQLREELSRVRNEQQRLAASEELLLHVIALRESEESGQPLTVRRLSLARDTRVTTSAATPDQIKRLFADGGRDREWKPFEVAAALDANGTPARIENVRVALRRMTKRGEIERGDKGYRLASDQARDH
jgi:hypothetical protein